MCCPCPSLKYPICCISLYSEWETLRVTYLFSSESCLLFSDLLIALMFQADSVFYFRRHRFPCSPLLFNFSSQAERMFRVHNVHVLLMWGFHNRVLIVRIEPHPHTVSPGLTEGSVENTSWAFRSFDQTTNQ